jgi:hypothetical protein
MLANCRAKMDKMVKSRELPCVRRSRSFNTGQVVSGVVLMPMERMKSDGDAEKKQKKKNS